MNKIKYILLFVILLVIFLFVDTFRIKADAAEDVTEVPIENSQGKVVGRITNRDGEIEISVDVHTASTSIRWGTIGFTITRQPLKKMIYNYASDEGTYRLEGYEDVSTVYSGGHGILWFENAVDKNSIDNPATGMTTTTYRFSSDQVEEALKEDFSNITNDTPIYLHGIFETYQKVNGNKVGRSYDIRNWKEILLKEYWNRSNNQLDDFASFFNMQIKFKPDTQITTIYYKNDENKNIKVYRSLAEVLPGNTVSWINEDEVINHNGKSYELYKYVVKRKGSEEALETHSIGDSHNCKLSNIQNGSTTVLLGGMDIYLYYRENQESKITIRAVDVETNTVIKDVLYEGTIRPNQDFSKAVDQTVLYNGHTYQKTKSFYYSYTDQENATKKVNLESARADGAITFKVPNIKKSTNVNVTVYYNRAAAGTIPVTVKAVNKLTGQTIKTLTTGSVQAGKTYTYTVNPSVTEGGKNYNFTGEWKWSYKMNSPTSPTMIDSGSSTKVEFTAPSADKITGGITVNVLYDMDDVVSDKIILRTIMVSSTGGLINKISEETVTRSQSINKSIQSQVSVNGLMYVYLNKWDYTYTTATASDTKTGTGMTASFTIPSTTKLGSIVTLKLYYQAEQMEVEVPEQSAPITLPMDSPTPYAVINGDKYKASYFTSEKGISTTESQYVYVKTKDYLLGYSLVNRTGKITYNVPVTMNYTLHYYTATPEEFGGPQEVIDTVSNTQYIEVEKAYSYWEIENLDYFTVNMATVYNYSLPEGKVTLNANQSYLNLPSLDTSHSKRLLDHVIPPKQVTEGITIDNPEPISSETSDRPQVDFIDLTSYALTMTEDPMVKNDYLMFNGSVVLSSTPIKKIAPSPNASPFVHTSTIIHDKTLYKEGQVIEATKLNGVNKSTGTVNYYLHPRSVSTKFNLQSYTLSVNDVTIHTPVICEPIVSADNEKWTQVIKPDDGAYQIILDPDTTLNDFTVRISNTLLHSDRLGYSERDFSRSFIDPANISYIAKKSGIVRNEMRLPFDVYYDNFNDKNPENDQFIKSGTWIILGRSTSRFYVPMWVQEGVYTAEFRTVAVNGVDKLNKTETTRNAVIHNYIATAQRKFQVSGRIYGLTMYDMSDDKTWKEVFRQDKTMFFKYFEGAEDGTKRTNYHKDYAYYYKVGTKDQYGKETGRLSKYTFPLVNGSHPKFKNRGVLKTGYAVRFMIDTIGEMYSSANVVRIMPTFYYVDAEGKNRQQVDIYYSEEINGKHYPLVNAGDGIDLVNIKTGEVGNIYSRIPEKELKHTASVLDMTYSKLAGKITGMYSYTDIRLFDEFRTFIGLDYAKKISKLPSYMDVKEKAKQDELSLSKYMQRWYGTYKLPVTLYVAPSGYDVFDYMKKHGIRHDEDFWLRDGYIIVNFNIVTIDKNGKQNLSYINANNYLDKGHCSMWVTEGAMLQKTDNKKAVFNFKAGDFLINYSSQSYRDDYTGVVY